MAKKDSELDNIFRRTAPDLTEAASDNSDLDQGNIRPTGVGLREGEIMALDSIGAQLGQLLGTESISRNALLRIAARMLIEQIRSGKLTLAELAGKWEKPQKPRAKIKL